jgi:membrane protease YdiL (CAAX protease family)
LFTLLVRRAGWSVFAALLVSSVLFGLAHLQVVEIQLLAIVFGNVSYVTRYVLPYAAGGALFAWLTWRWQSLWPAIALHGLMNFWWDLTTGEHSRLDFAIDPMSAAQAVSAVLAIGMTLLYRRRERDAD